VFFGEWCDTVNANGSVTIISQESVCPTNGIPILSTLGIFESNWAYSEGRLKWKICYDDDGVPVGTEAFDVFVFVLSKKLKLYLNSVAFRGIPHLTQSQYIIQPQERPDKAEVEPRW